MLHQQRSFFLPLLSAKLMSNQRAALF